MTGLQHTELVGSTLIYRNLEAPKALETLASLGFRSIELCIVPGFCPHVDLTRQPEAEAERLVPMLDRLGLRIVSVNAGPGYFNGPEPGQTANLTLRCIHLGAALQAETLILPPGLPAADDQWESEVRLVAERLIDLADVANAFGLQLCVEAPHWNTLAPSVESAAQFFEMLGDSRIGCVFDTSHVFRGEDISLIEGLRRIGVERIRHLHLRDVIGEDAALTPGRGHADFVGLFRELRVAGYSGRAVLELEFDGADEQKRTELRFAQEYLRPLLAGRPLSLGMRLRTASAVKLAERLVMDPKLEIRRHRRMIAIARAVRPALLPLMPIKTYEGQWRNRWRIWGRTRVVRQRPNSVVLARVREQPLRVGIIGCGYAGTMHAYGYDRLAGVQVVGVCDSNANRAAGLASKIGCPAFATVDSLLRETTPNLVSVCTREWLHREHTIQALEAGVDVFCEKIIATRRAHAQEMVDLAQERQRVLAVNYNYRFIPGVQKLKEIIESRCLGNLQSLHISAHAYTYHHALDLTWFLGGEILEVAAKFRLDAHMRQFGGTNWADYDSDIIYVPAQNLVAAFHLRNGATACITSSRGYNLRGSTLAIDAVLDEGAIALSGINFFDVSGTMTWTAGRSCKGVKLDHMKSVFARGYEFCFYKSVESFVNAYLSGGVPETPGAVGLFNLDLDRATYASGVTGKWVAVDRIPLLHKG